MPKLQTQTLPKNASRLNYRDSCTRDIGIGLTVSVFMIGAVALLSWAMTIYMIANPITPIGMPSHSIQQR